MRRIIAAVLLAGPGLAFSALSCAAAQWVDVFGSGMIWLDLDSISQKNGLTYFTLVNGPATGGPPGLDVKSDKSDPTDAINCKTREYYHHDILNLMKIAQGKETEPRYQWAKHPDMYPYPDQREALRVHACGKVE